MGERGKLRDIKELADKFNMFVDSAKGALTQSRCDKDVFMVQRVG